MQREAGAEGKGSALFMCLLRVISEPGHTAAPLSRIIIKLGQWIKVTERQILPQYKNELPEDKTIKQWLQCLYKVV